MIVLKFGGTSVGSSAMMDKTLDIAGSFLAKSPVLVSSAMTKITDALVALTKFAAGGDDENAQIQLKFIQDTHRNCYESFLGGKNLAECRRDFEALFAELESLIRGLTLIKEASKRSQDIVLSFGERMSTRILYYRALEKGFAAELLDARDFIKTDEQFTSANLLKEATEKACREKIDFAERKLVITQGFIGSTEKGVSTTLGRGGSDYSATIIGAALGAEEVQIWTDVDGIMTTDPRLIPEARVLDEISYEEAAELSYFGAKVIHPSTIQPAVELDIPVWVKNTKNPSARGTCIRSFKNPAESKPGLKAMAGKRNVSVITVHSTRMLHAYGFLRSIFQVFENHKVSVDLVATSEVSVSVTVNDSSHIKAIKRDIEEFARVEVEEQKSILCLVGKDLWKDSRFIAKVFAAIEDIPVRLITLGASDINLSLVVPQTDFERATRLLHDALFA